MLENQVRASAGRSIYDLYSEFCPTTGETSHLLRFVSRRQPQLPRRWRRILGARGRTPLRWAAQSGHAAVVELLISAGATVDAASNNGHGPGFRVFLGVTIRFVSRRQPQLLLLPRRILGARGRTALHEAALQGHAAVVEQLISAGATVDAADNDGRGPGNGRGPRRVFGSFWDWL